MGRPKNNLLADIAIGLLAGLVATKVTGLAQEALARPMPEGVKEHEERLRPEPTSRIAAPAGFATGAAMSLIVDEMLVPALGFSPPNRAFPAITHVRGFLNHLAYGAAAALTTEAAYRLTGTTPGSRRGGTRP